MALTPEQRSVIKRSLNVAKRKGASPRERKALIQTLLVESGARDLPYGDRDSEGALQQRPSQGWGPASESLETDVAQFLQRARTANRGKGSAGQLAQAVQRSAFPGRYDEHSGDANKILRHFAGKGSSKAKGSTRTVTETTPGVDRSEQRRMVKLAYLRQRGKPGALLELKQGLDESEDIPAEHHARTIRQPAEKKPRSARAGLSVTSALDREAERLGIPITAKQEPGHASGGDHDPAVKGATARDYGGSEQQRRDQYRRWLRRFGLSEKDHPFGGRDVNVTRGDVRVQIITRPHGSGPHNHIGIRKVR